MSRPRIVFRSIVCLVAVTWCSSLFLWPLVPEAFIVAANYLEPQIFSKFFRHFF